jgi:hypothetical protein
MIYCRPHSLRTWSNVHEFVRIAVVDILLEQTDRRQAIYVSTNDGSKKSLLAHFIDHGHSFGGALWTYAEHHLRPALHKLITSESIEHAETAIQLLQSFSIEELNFHARLTPKSWWTAQDRSEFPRLMRMLALRQQRLAELTTPLLELITDQTFATTWQVDHQDRKMLCPLRWLRLLLLLVDWPVTIEGSSQGKANMSLAAAGGFSRTEILSRKSTRLERLICSKHDVRG